MYQSIFFSDHCIKQNKIDFMLPWACSVIDHREHQNVVKTSVTNLPLARVPLLYFYHILMSSVIYYWTDAWQHGIYLLNMIGCTFVQATQIVTGQVCCQAYLLGWRLWEKMKYMDPCIHAVKNLTTSNKGNVRWLEPNSDSQTFARNNVQSRSQS